MLVVVKGLLGFPLTFKVKELDLVGESQVILLVVTGQGNLYIYNLCFFSSCIIIVAFVN